MAAPARPLTRLLASALALCGLCFEGHARDPHPHPWGRSAPADAAPVAVKESPRVPIGEPLWIGQPELKKALGAMERGGWSIALKTLKALRASGVDAALEGVLPYLIGRCEAELGRAEPALKALAEARGTVPALSGHIAALEVKALRAADRHAEADEALKLIPPESPKYANLNLRGAKRMLATGDPGGVVALVERVTPHIARQWFLARFALLEAEARLKLDGDEAAWRARMAEIWRRWGRYRAGADAEEILLEGVTEEDTGPIELTEWVARAVRHIRKGEVMRARAIVKMAERVWPEASAGLAELVGGWRTLKRAPFTTLKRVEEALEKAGGVTMRRHLMHLKAEGLRKDGRAGKALRLYRRLAKEWPASEMKSEMLWDGGELAKRMRRLKAMRDLYTELASMPDEMPLLQQKKGRVLWEAAWAFYRLGDLEQADAWLTRLINERPAETDTSRRTFYERATYWRARIHHKRGELREARALWAYLVERYPLSYYATLSRHWLGSTGGEAAPFPGVVPDAPFTPEALARNMPGLGPKEQGVAVLWRLGLFSDARRGLKRLHRLGEITDEGLDFASALYREDDNLWISHWLMKKSEPLMFPPNEDPRRRWQASFPTPYAELVHQEAEAQAIDPMLVWAIMRQESGFRARIKSYANAYGLMQLLKGTAAIVARKMLDERRAPSVSKLYTPEANIRYGTAFLARLLERYQGHPALAIAAYNAGPGRVNGWLKKVGHLDVDEFVEDIPFDQTRAYTRTVLRSYAAYRALYGPRGNQEIYIPLRLRPDRGLDAPVASNGQLEQQDE